MNAPRSTTHAPKSRSELQTAIRDQRYKLASLGGKLPESITFRELPGNRVRIYYLSASANLMETTLMYTDIMQNALGGISHSIHHLDGAHVTSPVLPRQPLIDPTFQVS